MGHRFVNTPGYHLLQPVRIIQMVMEFRGDSQLDRLSTNSATSAQTNAGMGLQRAATGMRRTVAV